MLRTQEYYRSVVFKIAAGYCLATLAVVAAQSSQPSTPAVSPAPKIKIFFPSGISLENVWLVYGLSGPKGRRAYRGLSGSPGWNSAMPAFDPHAGQGRTVAATSSADHYYEIVALQDGNSVDHFMAIAWAKGCQMVSFSEVIGTNDLVLPFTCTPLGTVVLTGRLQGIELNGQSTRVTVWYGSIQIPVYCDRLCVWDGPGQNIPNIASAPTQPDGSFKIVLPDFAHDPVVSGDPSGHFELNLKNPHKSIVPLSEDWQTQELGDLRVSSSYPSDMVFVPRSYPKMSSSR